MTKTVASETDVPAGLDVVPMEPGTIVGSRDQQGTDGTTRTDRPGELLGTPVKNETRQGGHGREAGSDQQARRDQEAAKQEHVRNEVDRANREELPLLGGVPIDDGWKP